MPVVTGRGATLVVDGERVELKHGDEIPSSLPKAVRDALVESESAGVPVDAGPVDAPKAKPTK